MSPSQLQNLFSTNYQFRTTLLQTCTTPEIMSLFQALPNKGNLTWKELQDHVAFHNLIIPNAKRLEDVACSKGMSVTIICKDMQNLIDEFLEPATHKDSDSKTYNVLCIISRHKARSPSTSDLKVLIEDLINDISSVTPIQKCDHEPALNDYVRYGVKIRIAFSINDGYSLPMIFYDSILATYFNVRDDDSSMKSTSYIVVGWEPTKVFVGEAEAGDEGSPTSLEHTTFRIRDRRRNSVKFEGKPTKVAL